MLGILVKVSFLIRKTICFIVFGICSIPFTFMISPVVFFLSKNCSNPYMNMRRLVSISFNIFIKFITLLKIVDITVINRELLNSPGGLIVCPNHPTFIEVAVLIGMIPNATTITKSGRMRNLFLGNIASKLYIPNSTSPEETIAKCSEYLNKGTKLLHFPEGTRTDFSKELKFKRSAAHIALNSGYNILPVAITVNETAGFGKNDNFFSTPKDGVLKMRIEFLDIIKSSDYKHLSNSIGARELTAKLKADILRTKENDYERI